MKSFICLAVFLAAASANQVKITNHCDKTVWVGILGGPGTADGFKLQKGESNSVNFNNNWSGRIWGKTNCDENGKNCESGDCGPLGCVASSLAEVTFGGNGGVDFYDISLVDGFNLPVRMVPADGFEPGDGHYNCGSAECVKNINDICPDELKVKNDQGETVACLSACSHYNTDEYCCRGEHDTPDTCDSSDWDTDYPNIFKQACPDAYSYAYDDQASTFTCRGSPLATYEVTFCP